MEVESQLPHSSKMGGPEPNARRLCLLSLNLLLFAVGCGGMPLLLRLYFIHGGRLIWFSAFLQTAAFPLLLPPLLISSYLSRTKAIADAGKPRLFSLTRPAFLSSAILGLLIGISNLFYAYGLSYVPVSTSSLLLATQLIFTALFAFFIVKQKFTPFSINAVVLLTIGSAVLAVNSSGDRPRGEEQSKYYFGFAMMLGSALLDGLLPALMQLMYVSAGRVVTYSVAMEMQVVMGFFATAFCAVGMTLSNNFQAIPHEAKEYGLGESDYYLTVITFAVVMQCFYMGRVGSVLYSSALLTGIVSDSLLPVILGLAAVFYREPFTHTKAVALVLALWGFTSYIFGERKDHKKKKKKKNAMAAVASVLPPSEIKSSNVSIASK